MRVAQPQIYEEVYYFLASQPTPEQILAFRPSQATQQRITELLDANKRGKLRDTEEAELNEFERVEHFVRMLKLHTKKIMTKN